MNAFQLSEQYVDEMAALQPVNATFQGIPGHDGEWDDFSSAGVERLRATMHDYRKRVAALPPDDDPWQRLAAGFLQDMLERDLLQYDTEDRWKALNNIASPLQSMRMVFDVMEKGDAMRQRLATLGTAMRSYRDLLDEGRKLGHVVARRQVEEGVRQCRVHAGEKSWFRSVDLPEAESARAAYGEMGDWLEQTYLPATQERDAVGRERYEREVRRFLGASIDLEDTYRWGWEQVRSIRADMERVAGEIRPDGTVPEVLDLLNTDPTRAEPSVEAFLAAMRERQQRALQELDGSHFDVPAPLRDFHVNEAPPGGPLGAYYIPPSEDLTRPGSIWYSLGEARPIAVWHHVSTAYHEGFPGHHLQCGIQVCMRDRLSKLQRIEGYSGFAEGWALYAELLMRELGYFEKPDYVMGMLAAQMIRACRVVIDIGSHLELPIPADAPFHPGERWTYELGVEMLETLAGEERDHARSELIRYLGWPAQAISYKVGERLILQLRDALKERQGAAFRLDEFHRRVLGVGNVALERLRSLVLD